VLVVSTKYAALVYIHLVLWNVAPIHFHGGFGSRTQGLQRQIVHVVFANVVLVLQFQWLFSAAHDSDRSRILETCRMQQERSDMNACCITSSWRVHVFTYIHLAWPVQGQ
jgi:hypothetical protein